jgi:hypothetical protein
MFGLQNLFMYFCSTSLDYGLVIISSALFNYLTYNLYSPMCWYSVYSLISTTLTLLNLYGLELGNKSLFDS